MVWYGTIWYGMIWYTRYRGIPRKTGYNSTKKRPRTSFKTALFYIYYHS